MDIYTGFGTAHVVSDKRVDEVDVRVIMVKDPDGNSTAMAQATGPAP